MATWSLWFAHVLPHAPTAPEPAVVQALRMAARSFFAGTLAWREWLEPTTTTSGTNVEYDFEVPQGAEIHRIERATLNGSALPIQVYQHTERDPVTDAGTATAVISQDLNAFRLMGVSSAGQAIQVSTTLIPSNTATGLPDHLANRHLDAIKCGALSRLMMVPGTEYANPALAAAHATQFGAEIGEAAVAAYRGYTNQMPRLRSLWC